MSFERNKKRIRQILVCDNCHKKKRKCDLNDPCSSCIKLNIESTCSYNNKKQSLNEVSARLGTTNEEQNENDSLYNMIQILNNKIKDLEASITIASLNKQRSDDSGHSDDQIPTRRSINMESDPFTDIKTPANDLWFIGTNPFISNKYSINFLDSLNNDTNSDSKVAVTPYGPLSLVILVRQDPGAVLLWKYLISPNRKHFSIEPVLNKKHKRESLEAIEQESQLFYGNKYIKRLQKKHSVSDIIEVKQAINNFGMNLGITFHSAPLNDDSTLLEQIKEMLPDRKTLDMLVKVFFSTLYPLFPILDESAFRADISRITGADGNIDGRIEELILASKNDLAFLATLLITVRLSYLSLFSNSVDKNDDLLDDSVASEEKQFLVEHPVPIEAARIADLCIKEFDLKSESSMALFQALSMMHIYHNHAPEADPSRNHQSVINIGILYQMATSLFLNRDPDYLQYFLEREVDERMKFLKRNLWYFLIRIDIEDSIIYGSPICIIESNYDTKKPFVHNNLKTNDTEILIIMSLDKLHPVLMSLKKILDMIFRVRSDMKVSDLAKDLCSFEVLVQNTLGSLSSYLVTDNNYPGFLKIQKFKLYLLCKLMLLYIYYTFSLYFENRDIELNLFFFKKLCAIVYHELGAISGNILYYCENYFGPVFTLIVNPVFEYLFRMRLVLVQFRIRIKNTLKSIHMNLFKSSMSNVLMKLYAKMLSSMENIVSQLELTNTNTLSTLNTRYFYAWKSSQEYKYGRTMLSDDRLYEVDEKTRSNADLKYSLDQVIELENFLTCCLEMMSHETSRYVLRLSHQLLHDHQIDKLWLLYDLLRQEYISSRNGISKYYKRRHPNLGTQHDNPGLIDFDSHILHENSLFGNFAMDDFFSDNPFNIL